MSRGTHRHYIISGSVFIRLQQIITTQYIMRRPLEVMVLSREQHGKWRHYIRVLGKERRYKRVIEIDRLVRYSDGYFRFSAATMKIMMFRMIAFPLPWRYYENYYVQNNVLIMCLPPHTWYCPDTKSPFSICLYELVRHCVVLVPPVVQAYHVTIVMYGLPIV